MATPISCFFPSAMAHQTKIVMGTSYQACVEDITMLCTLKDPPAIRLMRVREFDVITVRFDLMSRTVLYHFVLIEAPLTMMPWV